MAIEVEDVVYRQSETGPLVARIYRPAGAGPLPAVVSVHGGRWVSSDRLTNTVIDRAVAEAGFVVVALDFRMPPAVRYPEPVADINFAIRWLKHNAQSFGATAAGLGGIGTSSGGHQLMLNALRPRDPRYAALALPGSEDAGLAFVVACWPVLDPLARYRMAKQKDMKLHVEGHEAYWPDEASMAEGNPQLIVERGEAAVKPPVLLIQGTADTTVLPEMTRRFAESYRAKGGSALLDEFEGVKHTFITQDPDTESSRAALSSIVRYVLGQTESVRQRETA